MTHEAVTRFEALEDRIKSLEDHIAEHLTGRLKSNIPGLPSSGTETAEPETPEGEPT